MYHCSICGETVILFSSPEDRIEVWTHDENTPLKNRNHLPHPVKDNS